MTAKLSILSFEEKIHNIFGANRNGITYFGLKLSEKCGKQNSIGEVEKPQDERSEPNVDMECNPNTCNGTPKGSEKDPPPTEIGVKTFVGQNTGWSSSRNDSRSQTIGIGNSSAWESLPISNKNVKVIFLTAQIIITSLPPSTYLHIFILFRNPKIIT